MCIKFANIILHNTIYLKKKKAKLFYFATESNNYKNDTNLKKKNKVEVIKVFTLVAEGRGRHPAGSRK